MACGNPTYWAGGRGLAKWQPPHRTLNRDHKINSRSRHKRNIITHTSHKVTGDYPIPVNFEEPVLAP